MVFSKKKIEIDFFAVIDFTEIAEEYCVGGDSNKRIYFYTIVNGEPVLTDKSYPYSEARVKELKRNGILVIDRTIGMHIPKECLRIPSSKLILGRLEIRKVIG